MTTSHSVYDAIKTAYDLSTVAVGVCDNELDRPYVLHHHAVMQAAWDKVRNFESDSDREFNDQVWVRAKEEAAMSREEYDRQLDASHMATFE